MSVKCNHHKPHACNFWSQHTCENLCTSYCQHCEHLMRWRLHKSLSVYLEWEAISCATLPNHPLLGLLQKPIRPLNCKLLILCMLVIQWCVIVVSQDIHNQILLGWLEGAISKGMWSTLSFNVLRMYVNFAEYVKCFPYTVVP